MKKAFDLVVSNSVKLLKVDVNHNRIYGLDILRALAILFVMLGHSRHFVDAFANNKYYMFFVIDGVTIFFVLSGYLIGGLLIKSLEKEDFTRKTLFRFWVKRWFRTLPNYYLILTILVILSFTKNQNLNGEVGRYYLFVQNFMSPHPAFFPEAWSLSIEEWFYIILGIALFATASFSRNSRKNILIWIFLIIIITTAFRSYRAFQYNCIDNRCWGDYIRQNVVTRLDSLMLGVLGAYIMFYKKQIWDSLRGTKYFCLGVILILIPQFYDFFWEDMFFKNYLLFSFVSIGTLLLIPRLSEINNRKGVVFSFVTTTSLISYSMYLINYTLIREYCFNLIHKLIPLTVKHNIIIQSFNYLLFWAICYLFAILLYKYFEMPVTAQRDKIKI